MKSITTLAVLLCTILAYSQQELLPPALPWKGKSESLVAKKNDPWITPSESSGLVNTPTYDETMLWLKKLCDSSPEMQLISIGTSAQGRSINMVIVSKEVSPSPESLRNSPKPLLLAQAGIHAGEIDGKDAGMMLLRDIAHGKKQSLINNVNILFIPILNVDGHERSSSYNRVNQRGPANMGWRTNARNLNLNRDYAKLDTEGIQSVVNVINEYEPDLYLDLHVTDGADYQYDITYGHVNRNAKSPAISSWLTNSFTKAIDKKLKDAGHIPGPLLFAANNRDFSDGNAEWNFGPRFSHSYGDLRHTPTVLVENHSLKPYKQRVLGTYIFLEGVIELLARDAQALQAAITADKNLRNKEIVLTTKRSAERDKMTFLGVESKMSLSPVTGKENIEWLGKPFTSEISVMFSADTEKAVTRPARYWIPSTYKDVIARLKMHGIKMEIITSPVEKEVTMYRATDPRFARRPSEGHVGVTATLAKETLKETFYPGSAIIDTDQPLGDLAVFLLEPECPDSFFQWGFFHEIFDRTEYAEEYVMEPMARQMLANDPELKKEFEEKKKSDSSFADNANAIYRWFYEKSGYADQRYLLYPIGLEY
jgi:hypothetical protein